MKIKRTLLTVLCCVLAFSYLRFFWRNALSLDDTVCGNTEAFSQEPPLQQSENQPAASKNCYLYIDLDQHHLLLYKNGIFIKSYPVSGGKASTPSPAGTWRIISKDTWGEGFGGSWLGFNVPWGKYGIHGTQEPWFIGKSNSSKGCIRMKNKDVQELFQFVPHGAVVKIVNNTSPFRTMKNGDVGSDVLAVQKMLKELGYYHGGADGRFGNGLEDGVKRFQRTNKLYANGIINKKTYQLIMDPLE